MVGEFLRNYTRNDVAAVKRLKDAGVTQKEIARQTDVPPRTQRDWDKKGLLGDSATWPENQRWPGWTVDYLQELGLTEFEREAWEGNLAMIDTAERQGNRYLGWFFRRLVELDQRAPMPNKALDWALAIAGLPVVGHWLDCPACDDLAVLIEKHQPWAGGMLARQKRRAAYSQEARSVASVVRQCVLQAQSQLVLTDAAQSRVSQGPVYLAAFAERLPLFDRVRRGSPYRKFNLGGILLGILASPKGERNV